MGWKKLDELAGKNEIVIRLKQNGTRLPAKFLGHSVHQIAMVTGEGDIYCMGCKLDCDWIEGWIELPPPNWAKQ